MLVGRRILQKSVFSIFLNSRLFSSLEKNSSTPTVIYSWGIGTIGQLGHKKFEVSFKGFDSSYIQFEPRRLLKSRRFKNAFIGESQTIFLTKENQTLLSGKVINGDTTYKEPVLLDLPDNASIVNGSIGSKHAGLVDDKGKVYTWGHGGDWMSGGGQLGHGSRASENNPKLVSALFEADLKISQVSCGGRFTLFLTTEGEVLSCGVGEYGLLGTGDSSDSPLPTSIESIGHLNIKQIAAGHDHSLLLAENGSLYSFGRNNSGQLGHSDSYIDFYSMEDFPREVNRKNFNNENVVSVSAGNGRSAAITESGILYVWGARVNHIPKLFVPELFNGLKVKKVACGGDSSRSVTAVITEDDGLWLFGDKSSNLLGIASKDLSMFSSKYPNPFRVPSLIDRKVTDVVCGPGQHMIAFVEEDENNDNI
eukprot:gene7864-10673_t